MAVSKAKKEALREQFAAKFNKANGTIIAEYSGITAGELAQLRVELRKVATEFKVLKNRVARKAIDLDAQASESLKSQLKGPIGVAYMYGDVAAGAKAMLAFAKTNEKFKVTGGALEGKPLSVQEVLALSELPTKEELLARIVGTLVAPHRGLLQVVNGLSGKLVRVISAIKDTKS